MKATFLGGQTFFIRTASVRAIKQRISPMMLMRGLRKSYLLILKLLCTIYSAHVDASSPIIIITSTRLCGSVV